MTNILQRALISTPLGTLHTYQPIILTLYLLNNPVALTEHTPKSGVYIGTVRVIGNTFTIGCFWVEVVAHVGLGQLAEGAGFEAEEFEQFVEFGYVGCCERSVYVSDQRSV